MLYRRIDYNPDLEDGFGEDVLFVGVHAVVWHDRPFHPAVAFVESDDPAAEAAPYLRKSCQELVQAMVDYEMDTEGNPPQKHRVMMSDARIALAKSEGITDPAIETASVTQVALQDLYDACALADAHEELSGYVDGSLLDAAAAALRLGKSKGMEKYG